MNLEDLRKQIDALDDTLLKQLNERIRLAVEVGQVKAADGESVYAPAREKDLLMRLMQENPGPISEKSLRAVYREIMSAALAVEKGIQIAYLGPPATFTHQAAREKFGASVAYHECETITDVFTAVESEVAEYGVVPVENSSDGAVTHTLDQFVSTPLKICAEVYLRISHSLMAACPAEKIQKIYSKAEAFGQCRRWLMENMPGIDCIPVSSTARAAELAAKEEGAAAIASGAAAELYGLDVLGESIQDSSGNVTRFLVISRSFGPHTGEDKTSVVFSVKHKAGALHDVLSVFRDHELNMTKIESRPSKTKAWEYLFFVDVEGHVEDSQVERALKDVENHCMLTVLGSYPKAV